MSVLNTIEIMSYVVILLIATPLLGRYIGKVIQGHPTLFSSFLKPTENLLYRLAGIDPQEQMNARTYIRALLSFNLIGLAVLLGILLVQRQLPLNPNELPNLPFWLALNTAMSFVTNTNWQSYAGENTMSYFSQMIGLGVQNFLSAATGAAVVIALTRGLSQRSINHLGNFWVDVTRFILYVLIPLSLVLSLVLVHQGVVQSFNSNTSALTLADEDQTIPLGAVASQVAIKQLGTNGGGFFNANSAHPFENPTPLSNFVQALSILLIPSALTYTYGILVGSHKQGWVIFGVMLVLFLIGLGVALLSEYNSLPNQTIMEGKEVRFGIHNSVLWAVATTSASNGSINAMMSSLTPMTGFIAMLNILLGEVIFGGVGSGLYGMLIFVIITVFVAGLMVGRTPEYLGKKIEAHEIKMAMLAILLPSVTILVLSALAVLTEVGLSSRLHSGAHGLSEILYAVASTTGNNGSAFAGLNTNTDFYNGMLTLALFIGRFGVILPTLSIAGSMASKRTTPPSLGTFPTDSLLFGVLLVIVVLILGALTFFPILALAPIMEFFLSR